MAVQVNENFISEKEFNENPLLNSKAEPDNPLKQYLINYVGEKHNPDNDEVTVEMIVETVAKEFPEFLLAVAEENWIRGYRQAFVDIERTEKLHTDQQSSTDQQHENA
jgi:hypothetical protein